MKLGQAALDAQRKQGEELRRRRREEYEAALPEMIKAFERDFPGVEYGVGPGLTVVSGDLQLSYCNSGSPSWQLLGTCPRCGAAVRSYSFHDIDGLAKIIGTKQALGGHDFDCTRVGGAIKKIVRHLLQADGVRDE